VSINIDLCAYLFAFVKLLSLQRDNLVRLYLHQGDIGLGLIFIKGEIGSGLNFTMGG